MLAALLVLLLHEVPMRTTMEGGATLRERETARSPESGAAVG
jgi:hypothetical protein